MAGNGEVQNKKVPVWDGQIDLNVQIRGDGPPILYLHPAAGMAWDPFLSQLAQSYTVYAPDFPGTTPGDPYASRNVADLHDAVLIYEEAVRKLGLRGAIAIGQSFGGMLALELAATFQDIFRKIIVLDPIGLWRPDAPVSNWVEASPEQLAAMLFKDPSGPAAQAVLAMPSDPEAAVTATAQLIWNLGVTGRYVWPIPDRGLKKRLHRISAPTMVVWGEDDKLIDSSYAADFGNRIANARVEIVADSGHIPQVEQMGATQKLVTDFLGR